MVCQGWEIDLQMTLARAAMVNAWARKGRKFHSRLWAFLWLASSSSNTEPSCTSSDPSSECSKGNGFMLNDILNRLNTTKFVLYLSILHITE